jgi:hypothetical protein
MNESMLSHLETIVDVTSVKFKKQFQGTFRAQNPIYKIRKPITLPKNRNFEAALIYFATDNYLVNIVSNNQNFIYSSDKGRTWKTIIIATGAYELNHLNAEIKRQMVLKGDATFINIDANLNTFNSIIEISNENYQIDFTKENTLRSILGFNSVILAKGHNESQGTIQITSAKAINVHCDLIHGSYDNNGEESDIIYSFPAYKVPVGYKINEHPSTPMFLPVNHSVIKAFRFRVTDNKGNELNFKNEEMAFCIFLQQV